MSGFLPKKPGEVHTKRSVFMSERLWEAMEEIAASTQEAEDPEDRYDRQEVIRHACEKLYAEFLEHKRRRR